MYAGLWCVYLKERGHWEDLGLDAMITVNSIFNKQGGKAWNRFMWHNIQKSVGLL